MGTKAIVAWGLGLCFVSSVAAQRRVERRFAVAADVAIRIHNLVGTTRVVGWERDSIAVVAVIPTGGGSFFGGGGGRFAKLGIEGQDPAFTGPGSTLEVSVPRAARVWVKSGAAKVELRGLSGDLEVSSVTGSIEVEGSARVVTAESIDGDITIRGTISVGRARSGAGSITVTGTIGDASITTVQGRADLRTTTLSAARVETVSGPVHVETALDRDGRLTIETHDGSVAVLLAPPVQGRFDLSTVKGRIETGFNGGSARSRQFSVGKASDAVVVIRSFSGTLRVDSNSSASPGI